MTFEAVQTRATLIGAAGVDATKRRILASADLPPGVTAQATDQGILLSGKRLRRRMIDDPRIRNIAR